MRKRFEEQSSLFFHDIGTAEIPEKSRSSTVKLFACLKQIYLNDEYRDRILAILEKSLAPKKQTGRKGLNLWQIFVLAQLRMCENIGYDQLEYLAMHDILLRHLLGIRDNNGQKEIRWEYQRIYDNVNILNDEFLSEINDVIIEFGHGEVFKKKETVALRLKTDSYVLESNVHFPTDYNLLWDSARKSIETIKKIIKKYPEIEGWRKIKNWYSELKNLSRALGQASGSGGKNKEDRVKKAAMAYLKKARGLSNKLEEDMANLPSRDVVDLANKTALSEYISLLNKHIGLVDRRLLQGELIPHEEKMFSIFEQYTEWVTKGKSRPNVELGKRLAITTDQYHLIVDYQIMDKITDSEIVKELGNRVNLKYNLIASWSFDKGFWNSENKPHLQGIVANQVVMPKKGKKNQAEQKEESQPAFKKLRNQHSAVESNINELEHRGLDRCPDRGYVHFKRYVGLGVISYNIHKIGAEILKQRLAEKKKEKEQQLKRAARLRLRATG